MKKVEGTATKRSERLALAGKKVLVQFTRSVEEGSIMGYVLAVGPRFFLLALVDENIRFNGFQCLRLQDVRNLQVPAKYAAFVEAALKLRGERRPRIPTVVVDSVQELLRTASRAFPVITIHREKVAPDVCHIGRVVAVSDSEVSLLEIGPDARWDDEALSYRTKEITRVDFAGDYEQALTLVDNFHANRRKRAKASL
ncbi:MAG: hypothetical protein ACLPZY_11710 [Terracidiphilus sp.]|jgi:hypothetical protein